MSLVRHYPRTISKAPILRQNARPLLRAFFAVGFLIAIGGFVLQLAGFDTADVAKVTASSPQAQMLLGSIYLAATILLIRAPNAGAIFLRSWPILVLPIFAFLSAAWSPDAALTLRRSFAFLGTYLFGLSLASRFTFEEGLRLMVQTLSAAMALSVLWAGAFPAQGIHQVTDFGRVPARTCGVVARHFCSSKHSWIRCRPHDCIVGCLSKVCFSKLAASCRSADRCRRLLSGGSLRQRIRDRSIVVGNALLIFASWAALTYP